MKKYLAAIALLTAAPAQAVTITTSGEGFFFGDVAVGTSITRTVRLDASNFNPALPFFSWNPLGATGSYAVAPFHLDTFACFGASASCTITVTFSPVVPGHYGNSNPFQGFDFIDLHPVECNAAGFPGMGPTACGFAGHFSFFLNGDGIAAAVPGPIAGVGLPGLLLAGLTWLMRRRRIDE